MRLGTQNLSSGQEAHENMLNIINLQGDACEIPHVTQEEGQNAEDKQ